jgi:hypothetical protein
MDMLFATSPVTQDPEQVARRVARLEELGIGEHLYPALDAMTGEILAQLGTDNVLINAMGDTFQWFIGSARSALGRDPGREMSVEHGYCPLVVRTETARALPNVLDSVRTALEPPVSFLNISSYSGVPLKDYDGLVLGTVCSLSVRALTAKEACAIRDCLAAAWAPGVMEAIRDHPRP